MVSIGDKTLSLGDPVVAVAFKDANAVADLQQLKAQGLDIAELRYDLFRQPTIDVVNAEIAKFKQAKLPILFTIRTINEGGEWRGEHSEYFGVISHFLLEVDAVDIEMTAVRAHPRHAADLVAKIQQAGKTVVASFHDFEATPSLAELLAVLAQAKEVKADIIKIATTAQTYQDLATLTQFALNHKADNLIVIAMGDIGLISRISMPSYGSLLTFGYAGDMATAPGQLPLSTLVALLKQFYPLYSPQPR